jgi:hypothetical protein
MLLAGSRPPVRENSRTLLNVRYVVESRHLKIKKFQNRIDALLFCSVVEFSVIRVFAIAKFSLPPSLRWDPFLTGGFYHGFTTLIPQTQQSTTNTATET